MKRRHYVVLLALVLVLAGRICVAEVVPLGDLEMASAVNRSRYDPRGYEHRIHGFQKQLFTDEDDQGQPLALGSARFDRGFYISQTKVSWSYDLGGKYLSLTGYYGTTNGQRDGRTAALEVYGDDGHLLFRSAPLEKGEVMPLFVDLRGLGKLTIYSASRDKGRFSSLVLGDPVLTAPPATDTPPEGVAGASSGNAPPRPVIAAEPAEGRAPLTVRFNSENSEDADGMIMRYTWHFGDGSVERLDFNPTHTYESPGIYEAALVAEDDREGRGIARRTIVVGPAQNMPPRALFTADRWLIAPGASVRFDGSASRDRDGRLESYQWTFPDGSVAAGPTAEKTFPQMGIHMVALRVTDDEGASHTTRRRVRVDDGSNSTVFPLRDGSRILFIGNSLLGGIETILKAFAAAADPPFEIDYATAGKGGGKVEQYVEWDELQVRDRIMEGWDIVVIQPWPRPYQPDWKSAYKPYARTLVEWIRESGAYPAFLEPHRGYQQILSQQPIGPERIGAFAAELGAGYIPAGQAWLKVARDYPPQQKWVKDASGEDIGAMLYSDGIHQNRTGQLLSVMVIWEYLTGEPATEMSWPEDFGPYQQQIDHERTPYLRQVAAEVGEPAEPLRQ
jgi:PKD repeat protein